MRLYTGLYPDQVHELKQEKTTGVQGDKGSGNFSRALKPEGLFFPVRKLPDPLSPCTP